MKKHGGPWIEVLKEIPVSVPGRGGTPRSRHGAGNLPTQLHTQSHPLDMNSFMDGLRKLLVCGHPSLQGI